MSLTDDGGNVFEPNTQPAAPASDVFDWNTPDVSDEVINRVLTAGSNSTHSRERIAAFFMQPNISIADAAAFLRREYRVGGATIPSGLTATVCVLHAVTIPARRVLLY